MEEDNHLTVVSKQHLIAIGAIISLQLLGSGATQATYIALLIWALRSPRHAIQSLTLSWLVSFLNPGVFGNIGEVSPLFRWLILLTAFGRVFLTLQQLRNIPRPLPYLLIFSIILIAISLVNSYAPLISSFKLITFAIGSTTILLAFEATRHQQEYWKTWFSSLFLLVIVVGFPLYFHELGYVRNSSGFQGLLNHPQAYGVFIAPLLAWFTGLFLFNKDRSIAVILGLVLGWFSLFSSGARTGVLTIAIGLLLVLFIGLVYRKTWRLAIARLLKRPGFIISIFLLSLLLVMNWNTVMNAGFEFLTKGRGGNLEESFERSRGSLVENSWKNFFSNPWFGMGFGTPSDLSKLRAETDNALGLPLSSPVEKGFLPVAVLEEIGIVGTGLLLIFLMTLTGPVISLGNLSSLWLFLSCLLVNLGEAIFFSFGGLGLYTWLLIGFARILR